jgi:hypothetical protein
LLPTNEAEQIISKQVRPSVRAEKIEVRAPEPTPVRKEVRIEVQQPVVEVKKEVKEIKPELVKEKEKLKEKIKEKKERIPKPLVIAGAKKPEIQKELVMSAEELDKEKDVFFKKILEYCKSNDIQIVDYKIIRKKSEIELTIAVPSRIGSQEYYCKAKSKAKVNDGDLSSVYVQGQAKKLPVIFITTGELTKKAKDMLSRDFKGMIVKKI